MRTKDITDPMWAQAKHELFERMLAYAHSDTPAELTYETVSAAVLAWRLSHRSAHLYRLLDEIDRDHFSRADGFLVTAVVTKSGVNKPGGGFFALAASLGLHSAPPPSRQPNSDVRRR